MKAKKKFYKVFEHTADIGIKVRGRSLKELFKNLALAVFDIIAEKKPASSKIRKKIPIKLEARNPEELLVDWINELLYLSSVKELIFEDFKIKEIDNNHIDVISVACPVKNYNVNVEIKAATYHELEVKRAKNGWQVKVIFDV